MQNLLEYSHNCSRTSGLLWQYCKYESVLNANGKKFLKLMLLLIQQTMDVDPKAIQQINFNGNLEQQGTIFFHYLRSKRNNFSFFTSNSKSIRILFFALI